MPFPIARMTLVIVLGLPAGAQDAARQKAPMAPTKLLSVDDLGVSRLKPGDPIPTLNRSVTVEAMGLRIPPPPPSPRYASEHFRAIQEECSESLAYLNRELDRLNRDQAADIASMRSQPELAATGMDLPCFGVLRELTKDPALHAAESAFIGTTAELKEKQAATISRTQQSQEGMWSATTERVAWGQMMATIENCRRMGRQFRVADDQVFLDQYQPAFITYSRALNDYVARVVAAMDAPDSRLPMSSLVLARLCKIRILTSYLLMTKANFQVWASSAGTGSQEPTLLAEAYEPTRPSRP